MKHIPHNALRVIFVPLLCLTVFFSSLKNQADADNLSPQAATLEQPFVFNIEHPQTTIPLPGVKLYPMPHVWDNRIDTRLAMTSNGDLYAGCGYLWKSTDRGQTWTYRELPVFGGGGGFGILVDDVFILAYDIFDQEEKRSTVVIRSTDYGETWSQPFRLEISPYDESGGGWTQIYQHPDGTAMLTVTLRHRDKAFKEWDNPQVRGTRDHIFRSTDGGKTWGDRTLLGVHTCETSIFAPRNSKKMLAYIRVQRGRLPQDPVDLKDKTGAKKNSFWAVKNGAIAESHDNGRTWENLRLFDTLGSVPGEIIQAPDGRIAAVWMQRYPYEDSEIRMRISHDLGETWSKNTYSLMKGQGLPSSIVYPDGTVVTVAENTKLDSQGKVISERTMAAVQWKMPEE